MSEPIWANSPFNSAARQFAHITFFVRLDKHYPLSKLSPISSTKSLQLWNLTFAFQNMVKCATYAFIASIFRNSWFFETIILMKNIPDKIPYKKCTYLFSHRKHIQGATEIFYLGKFVTR